MRKIHHKKHYEPEFFTLHPQIRHTAQWIFEHDETEDERKVKIMRAIASSKKHCEKKYGIK